MSLSESNRLKIEMVFYLIYDLVELLVAFISPSEMMDIR